MVELETKKLIKINTFISKAYECSTFVEFLKLAIFSMHEIVMYDSGMFFCAISKDSSFFKPYISGPVENYYDRQAFEERKEYRNKAEANQMGKEAYVFTAKEYAKGLIDISEEPRSNFLKDSEEFHIACIRIVYKGQFLGEIYLHRSKDKDEFSDEEILILKLLQPHVSTIFSNIHTLSAIKSIETGSIPGAKKGLCILDESMSVENGNVIGIEILKTTTIFGSSVLYHVKELCKDTLNDGKKSSKSVLKTQYGNLQIEIIVRNGSSRSKKTEFIILMDFLGEEQIVSDYKFKFSKREAEIIDELIQGKNNQQIAKALNLSENTIKTHIKNIYKKAGVSNRTELTYMLMFNAQ